MEGNVRDSGSISRAAAGCDSLIHGAAISPGSRREAGLATRTIEINISGTVNALSAANGSSVEKFLYLGSAAVYGAGGVSHTPLSEDNTPPRPESIYAVSKFAAERIAQRIAADDQLDLRCVRIGSVFGPWEHDTGVRDTLSAIYQVTDATLRGEKTIVLPRAGRRDWIYSRDVANAVLCILDRETPPCGVVNVGLGHEWDVADWCRRLEAAFPDTCFRIAEDGEPATVDYHGDVDRSRLDVSRLNEEIGFKPAYDLDRAFGDYLDWLGKQKVEQTRTASR